jgi:hypothetical protein
MYRTVGCLLPSLPLPSFLPPSLSLSLLSPPFLPPSLLCTCVCRLGVGYVDLYLMHSAMGGKTIETWDTMIELRRKGYIK